MRHTRVILLIFIIIALLINPVSALSKVAPYDPIPTQGNANLGGYREFIAAGHDCRIRQNGDIQEIRFDIRSYDKLDEFYFTIWRRNTEGTYSKIHSTENIRDSLQHVSGYNYKYEFSESLDNIQEGDFYGYRIKTTEDALYAYYKQNIHDDYYLNGPKHQAYSKYLSGSYPEVPDGFNWEKNADLHSDYIFAIECYMDNSYMIFLGNSILAGFDDDETRPDLHYSFCEPYPQTDPTGTIQYKWSDLDGDKSYQNMGINGDFISDIDSRSVKDAVDLNPQYVLIEGGVNDITRGRTSGYILNYWDSILDNVYNANPQIIPVILLLLPFNNYRSGQEYQLQRINEVNDGLIDRAKNDYPGSIVVDARDYVGFKDSDGYWRIDADKTCDDWLHYNEVGNQAIAQAIYDAMHESTSSISIPLSPGWNMISVPLNIDSWQLTGGTDPLPSCVSDIVRYNSETSQFEMAMRDGNSWLFLGPSFELEPGMGYWAWAEESCTIIFTGAEPSGFDMHLNHGWNLIGWYSTSTASLLNEADPLPDCVSDIVRYNSGTSQFEMAMRDGNSWLFLGPSFELEPGMGYWAWVDTEGGCDWYHE